MSDETEYYLPPLPPLIPRDDDQIRATLALWQQYPRSLSRHVSYGPDYGAGVIAGLRWGLGDVETAPINGLDNEQRPTLQEIGWEQGLADAARHWPVPDQVKVLPDGAGAVWFLGVEAALAWLRSAGDPNSETLPEITTVEDFEEWVRDKLTREGLLNG